MNFNVIVTDGFKKHARSIAKKHRSLKSDLNKLIESLEKNPIQGEPLGKGCYKVRLAMNSISCLNWRGCKNVWEGFRGIFRQWGSSGK